MARFHLVKDGVVTNTVVWDSPPPPSAYPEFDVVQGESGGIGWLWDGVALQPPPPAPPPVPVPASITRLQLILGMTFAGLITAEEGENAANGTAIPAVVKAVFDSLPVEAGVEARIRWAAMKEAERGNPLVAAVASAAGKSAAEMDQYFRDWSQL
jgi:hypothetical protein